MLAGCDPTGGDATCVLGVRGRLRPARLATRAHRRRAGGDAAALHRHRRSGADRRARGRGRHHAAGAAVPLPARAGGGRGRLAQPVDGYALATRLSYLLTGAGPDATLLAAAEAGELATEAGLWPRPIDCSRSARRGPVRSLRQRVVGDRATRHHGQGRVALPGLDRRHAGRARPGDHAVSVRRLEEWTDAGVVVDRARHVRRRLAGLLLRPAGAERRRLSAHRARSDPRRRHADAGIVPGRSRQGEPNLAGPARQVRARAAVLHAAATRRRRRSWSARRSSIHACPPASGSPSTPRTPSARAATRSWIRSASPSRTTTRSGAGGTPTPTSRSMPPAR